MILFLCGVLLIIGILFTVCLFLSFEQREKFHSPGLRLEDIQIYVIHKRDMAHRWDRLQKNLAFLFPKHKVHIVEPVSLEDVKESIDRLVEEGMIEPIVRENIRTSKKPSHGSHSPQSLSLYLTNMEIYALQQKNNPNQCFMVLEDDIDLHAPDFHKILQDILRYPPPDWGLIYLSCHFDKKIYGKLPIQKHLLPIRTRLHGMGAVLYHPRMIPLLLQELIPIRLQIDHDIPDKLILTSKVKAYVALDPKYRTILRNDNFHYGSSTQKLS